MQSLIDRFPWLGWAVVGAVEALALGIGFAIHNFGHLSIWAVPLFLLLPPAIGVVALVAGLIIAMSNGGNPFR